MKCDKRDLLLYAVTDVYKRQPYDESRGLLFDKNNVLLDPFAKAVTGQRNWGERPESCLLYTSGTG